MVHFRSYNSFATFFGMRCLHLLALKFQRETRLHHCFSHDLFLFSWICELEAPLNGSPYHKSFFMCLNVLQYNTIQ